MDIVSAHGVPPIDSLQIDHLQVLLQSCSIIACNKCISKFAQSRPRSVPLSSLNLRPKLHLQTRSITASKFISEFTRPRPQSVSPTLLDCGLPVSVSNGSGPSLRVRVRVQTEPLQNWRSGSSINPNCPVGYGSMVNSQPVRIGRVFSGSPSGSIYRFI